MGPTQVRVTRTCKSQGCKCVWLTTASRVRLPARVHGVAGGPTEVIRSLTSTLVLAARMTLGLSDLPLGLHGNLGRMHKLAALSMSPQSVTPAPAFLTPGMLHPKVTCSVFT